MFEVAGFDPKTLSDDELLERSLDLNKKMVILQRISFGSGQGIDQLSRMLQLIENERLERLFLVHWNQNENYLNETIETDPVLRDKEREARIEKEKKPIVNHNRPRMTVRRVIPTPTLHPVVSNQKKEISDE